MTKRVIYGLATSFIFIAILITSCVKSFSPPAAATASGYLVVEGVVIPYGERSVITLSRSWGLSDSAGYTPERFAKVMVEDSLGTSYNFLESSPGKYSATLSLDASKYYRLHVISQQGQEYLSTYEPVVITPPIDSLHWKQDGGVTIYADTHDATGKTKYYRWEYNETWEYHSYYESLLKLENGVVVGIPAAETFKCYDSIASTSVIIGTSKNLSENIITDQVITTIPDTSQKMSVMYSILVKQYGLSENAFSFWDLMRKNGSELGGLFDPQPSQISGNIRNARDSSEPVIGYFGISTVQRSRLYVSNNDLDNWQWKRIQYAEYCIAITDPTNPIYAGVSFLPAYSVPPGTIFWAKSGCVDCRLQGGTTTKPSYWP